MNILGLISQLIGIKTLRLTEFICSSILLNNHLTYYIGLDGNYFDSVLMTIIFVMEEIKSPIPHSTNKVSLHHFNLIAIEFFIFVDKRIDCRSKNKIK